MQRLKTENYQLFKDVVIDDIPPLALFVGANGTGKSIPDAGDAIAVSIRTLRAGLALSLKFGGAC